MRIFLAIAGFLAAATAVAGEPGLLSILGDLSAERVRALAAENFWFALVLCFVSGVLTSFTPCVYPMIPITINIFGRAAHEGGTHRRGFSPRTMRLAGVYVAGMCATYSAMGLVAGLTGSLFGKLLQSPWVLAFLTLLFLAFALAQWGLFKIALPAGLQTKLSSMGDSKSRVGIFFMGLFSGLIVSPCVGPVVAGILAFVFDTSNAWLGLVYFFSFSLGLGMLFLVIGGFSGTLALLPRSGPWMVAVNRILAALMLVASGYYATLWRKSVVSSAPTVAVQGAAIPWMTGEALALRAAGEKGAPLLVDFTAEWCAACHELDALVFRDSRVIGAVRAFVPLRIDVTQDNDENTRILERYGVFSLPAVVFVRPDGSILKEPRVHGVVGPGEFLDLITRSGLARTPLAPAASQ